MALKCFECGSLTDFRNAWESEGRIYCINCFAGKDCEISNLSKRAYHDVVMTDHDFWRAILASDIIIIAMVIFSSFSDANFLENKIGRLIFLFLGILLPPFFAFTHNMLSLWATSQIYKLIILQPIICYLIVTITRYLNSIV